MALGGAGCGCLCPKGMAGGQARDWSSACVPATAFCTVLALTSELLLLAHFPIAHWALAAGWALNALYLFAVCFPVSGTSTKSDANPNKTTFILLCVLTLLVSTVWSERCSCF